MPVSLSRLRDLVALSVVGLSLAGCVTDGVQTTASDVSNSGKVVDETTQLVLSNANKLNGYCPTIAILGDTNAYQSYTRGNAGNAHELIYQASITQTARECTSLGAEMFLKVGVAGRVLGGPKSSDNSKAVLPLRIVVKQEDTLLYSQLHKVTVQLNPPDRSGLFAKVDEAIGIPSPQERNVEILVGFDSGN
ncbi:hypothetical protein SAMN04515647_2277 [Cohaesibacter sp. ES.047]|uniref:hypothetical protein n=1 Tax=Cohaesibacter sp. ES.047 TaxID=1798205 RepID=UPI000BB79785|nr:hypothetical protein [Cohaesibacter sp. ES.047]SNY92027.1 hypothetical protein SAMN04515647_2277 [Cohaesibacter sp. ES.047]